MQTHMKFSRTKKPHTYKAETNTVYLTAAMTIAFSCQVSCIYIISQSLDPNLLLPEEFPGPDKTKI